MTDCYTSFLNSSSLYKEITKLPVFQSVEELYRSTKSSSRVLNTGLAVVEYSVSSLIGKVFTSSSIAVRVDNMAGEGVSKLTEKYPALQTSPKEIRDRTSNSMQKTVRDMMKTGPGQMMLHGLDWALDTSEGILKRMKPRDRSPRKRKVTRSTLQKQAHPVKDHSYASEDSGACDAEGDSIKAHKSQQTMLSVKSEKQPVDLSLQERAYRLGILYPLEVLVKVLKSVRRYAGGKRQKPLMKSLTPEKRTEIGARRKISPRKKVSSSFLGSIKQKAYMVLGYTHLRPIDLGAGADGESVDRDDAEKKRKHDEILTDEDLESDDEDIANFDFENYDSEDDPDYEPSSAEESSESESEEELVESDIEMVHIDAKAELVQLKEKDVKSDKTPKPSGDAPKPGTPVEKAVKSDKTPKASGDAPKPTTPVDKQNAVQSDKKPKANGDPPDVGTPVDKGANISLKPCNLQK